MKQNKELTLTIDNESNSYLRQHGTDSNGDLERVVIFQRYRK